MSQEGTQAVFGMAIIDSAFREELLARPSKAVSGFDLTPEELAVLTSIRADSLERYATKFERWRLSKAVGREKPLSKYVKGACYSQRLVG